MPRPKSPSEPPSVTDASEPTGPVRTQEQPTIVSLAGGRCLIVHWRNVVVEVWATRADGALMAEVERCIEEVCKKHPKFSVIVLVVEQAPLPTPEARAIIQRMTPRFAQNIVATGLLLESTGFWASAVLGFVTSLSAFQNKNLRLKTFSALDDLVPWLVGLHNAETDVKIDSIDVRRVVTHCLARVKRGPT